jgi:hypothetical protein
MTRIDEPKTNETNATDEHVVLPIHVGDSEVHHIAFPASTSLPVVHRALLEHVEPPDLNIPASHEAPYLGANVDSWGRQKKGPSRSGVLENSPEFKKAASDVWEKAGRGRESTEAGTYLDQNNERGPIVASNTEGKMSLVVPKEAHSTLHTHPDHFNGTQAGGQPSGVDIDTAKKLGRSVYVVSKSGLQVVEKDGKVTNVYSNPDWMSRDNK